VKKFKNINIKNFKKKFIVIMLLIMTLLGTVQPIFAVDSSGSQKWVAGQWDSGIYTTDNNTNVGMLIRRLTNYTTKEQITVFCAEYKVDSNSGEIETGTHSKPTSENINKACKIAYMGWYSKYGDYVVNGGILSADMKWRMLNYVFTQQYIWEVLGQTSSKFKDADIQSQYVSFKAEVDQKLANIARKPSFSNTTVTVDVGTTTTLKDSNGVLKDYNSLDKTTDGIRIVHKKGENTMQITVNESCSLESYKFTDAMMESWGMIKTETIDNDTTVYITFRKGVQDQIFALHYNDPVTMSLDLKINQYGKLELSKLNEDGNLIDGSIFRVEGNNYSKDVTVTNGKIVIDKLKRRQLYCKGNFCSVSDIY